MKIAIVKLSALGDIVHAMAILKLIKQSIPQSRIDWIVEENFVSVLEHNPYIDTILPVNLKSLKTNKFNIFLEIKRLRKYAQNNYDVVIDMQGLIKSAIVSRILGSNVGFDKNSIRERMAAFLYKKSFFIPYSENVIMRNLNLVALSLELKIEEGFLKDKEALLFFTEEDRKNTASFIDKDLKTIIHILGSSWESKIYPKEKFVEIIDGLEGNHLLVWGNESEHASAKYVAEHTNARIIPRLTLNGLKALISSADLVIGADSGPTHFAWAMNRPSITIFGPTPSARNTLASTIHKVIDCGKNIDPMILDKQDFCIQHIESQKIVRLAKELLDA
ncbi:MAG: lipopolysaccharide heptosyltransferase I [Sulfurovum sp.]|nr:lipopolysaccharide heptosyltransferase I [Sulfurovum sp.]